MYEDTVLVYIRSSSSVPDVICIPLIHLASLTDTVWEYYCLTDPRCISFDVYSKSSAADVGFFKTLCILKGKKRQLTNFLMTF